MHMCAHIKSNPRLFLFLAYEMEKLKKKPSILQLTRALQRKQAPSPQRKGIRAMVHSLRAQIELTQVTFEVSLCPHGNKAADCYFCALDEDNCGVQQTHQHPHQVLWYF